MRCVCANCGNDDFEKLEFRRFTIHCSVCGHNTHIATGIDTRKYRTALIVLGLIILLGFSILAFIVIPFTRGHRYIYF